MSVLCALPFAAALFASCAGPAPFAAGYVEGEFVRLAPIDNAEVRSVAVGRGDRVTAGQQLAALEDRDAVIAVAQARAALAQAQAQLADLQIGKRPEEIAVIEATLKSADAQQEEAERVFARTRDLSGRGIATKADLDRAATSLAAAEASVGQAKANLAVARLPARPETIAAARHQAEQAATAVEQAEWRLSKRTITAPVDGRVTDVIRNPGDLAGPSAPVLSMLPDGAVRIRLYVPEASFSAVQVGDLLDVRCDGCPSGLTARVSYASPEPEFTPPVIYSLESRQKLSHLVEARPESPDSPLKPGQIVDVRLAERSP